MPPLFAAAHLPYRDTDAHVRIQPNAASREGEKRQGSPHYAEFTGDTMGYAGSSRHVTAPRSAQGRSSNSPGRLIPTTPAAVLAEHELRRRQRLVRVLTLGLMVPVILLIPSALFPKFIPGSLVALLIVLTGTVAAYILNRFNFVVTASYALILGIAAALGWQIVSKVLLQHGVDALDLRYYDLLVLPVLFSAVLLGRRGPFIIATVVSVFTLLSLMVLPRTPTLEQYWNAAYPYSLGSMYDVIALAVLFQWVAAVIGWLGADSIRRALAIAARVDEVGTANAQILAQAREIELARQRLQEGITQVQQVHAAIARGNLDARVRVDQSELLPMATSLNLLLDRLTRLTREQSQRAQMEMSARELAQAMRQMRTGLPVTTPNYTGTPFDEALVEFAALRNALPARGHTTFAPTSAADEGSSSERRNGWPLVNPGSLPPATRSRPSAPFDSDEWPSLE